MQTKLVKLYGAGGVRGLEPYQSGILISSEGHILTAFSSVLDTDDLSAVLWDGRKFTAALLGADPRLEVALLKIDGKDLPCFDPSRAATAAPGTPILALSNLFNVAAGDEPASVQHGIVSAVADLQARRGVFETPFRGPVYVLDVATNNPGAAGGALVDCRGELLAMLGKELRNAQNNTWLNYALPMAELRPSIEAIRSGKIVVRREDDPRKKPQRPLCLEALGLTLVPDVVERTPPYVDAVRPGSPAAQAGLRPDDLVILLGDRLITSCRTLRADLEYIDSADPIRLTVLRGQDLIDVELRADEAR
ncbi:MAG: serine protease [Pirellulales bacterium]|nr:serine protease [Pirellulales bacterium]